MGTAAARITIPTDLGIPLLTAARITTDARPGACVTRSILER
ncbi:hypothetical protein [Paraoerskovia sediminicola]|nr:hypothetical protein [Paraoerskovia sediminicola]